MRYVDAIFALTREVLGATRGKVWDSDGKKCGLLVVFLPIFGPNFGQSRGELILARILDPSRMFFKFRDLRVGFLLQSRPESLSKNRSDFFKAFFALGPDPTPEKDLFRPLPLPCWFFAMRRPFRNSAPFWGQN